MALLVEMQDFLAPGAFLSLARIDLVSSRCHRRHDHREQPCESHNSQLPQLFGSWNIGYMCIKLGMYPLCHFRATS